MSRKDNVDVDLGDINFGDVEESDSDDIVCNDIAWMKEEPKMDSETSSETSKGSKNKSRRNRSKVGSGRRARNTEPKKDYYNHRQRNSLMEIQKQKDEELRKQYEYLEVEDTSDLENIRRDRRRLADKLEKDPVFREKYLEDQEANRLAALAKEEKEKTTDQDIESIIYQLENPNKNKNKKILTEIEPVEDVAAYTSEVSDDGSVDGSFIGMSPYDKNKKSQKTEKSEKPEKAGIYIGNVENLIINLHM